MTKARSKKKSRVSIDRRQQESSGFVYEGSLNAIFVFSLDGKLLDANPAAADFYGYSTRTHAQKPSWWAYVRTGIPRAVTGPSHASEQEIALVLRGLILRQGLIWMLKGPHPGD